MIGLIGREGKLKTTSLNTISPVKRNILLNKKIINNHTIHQPTGRSEKVNPPATGISYFRSIISQILVAAPIPLFISV